MASSTMEESKLPGGYLVTPRVPQGLAAAVEGLTREVIRHSPEDIYVFAAHHFEKLLRLRERCGSEEIAANRDNNFRTLREMSQALRMKEADPANVRIPRNASDQIGWSLNETAKVLKRHRSIFGDTGGRISTDEVFQMANQKENRSRTVKPAAGKNHRPTNVHMNKETCPNQKPSMQNVDDVWKASGSRLERSRSNEASPDVISETRVGPRMMTQIPSLQNSTRLLAKDIKSELRKNRISSRERRNVWTKPDDGSPNDRSDSNSGGKASGRHGTPKKSSDRHKRMETDVEKRNRRLVESTTVSKERQSDQKSVESRAVSMDRVKDYVVQKFATTKSLEELQTLNYVEKVQEIIDETGPIIKGKVEELKSGMIGRSKRSSWFADETNDDSRHSHGSGSDDRGSGRNSSQQDSVERLRTTPPAADALKTRLTETQRLLENVSSKITSPRRSRSARASRRSLTTSDEIPIAKHSGEEVTTASTTGTSNRDNGLERRLSKTRNLLEDISSTLSRPMKRSSSAKSLRRHESSDDFSDLGSKDALKTRLDETRNLLEGISASFAMPGHKVGSAFGRFNATSGNLTFEEMSSSDPQNMPKVSLPAVRSASAKSSPGSVSRNDSDNLVLPAISPEAPKSKKIKEDLVLPVLSSSAHSSSSEGTKVEDDIDVFAEEDIPGIPVEEYIPEPVTEDVFRDSLNVTPDFDSIPQRPDSLEPVKTAEEIEADLKVDNLEERLQEIQKVEMEIEQVFTSKTSVDPRQSEDVQGSDVEKPLQELDGAEKVIERMGDSKLSNENEGSPECETEPDRSVEAVDKSGESGGDAGEDMVRREVEDDEKESNEKKEERLKDDKQRTVDASASSPEPLNYTYVLTEGSPHDIPDTVTTVIIPERTVQSPGLESLTEELAEDMDANLSPFSGDATTRDSDRSEEIYVQAAREVSLEEMINRVDEELIENIGAEAVLATVDDTENEVSGQQSSQSPTEVDPTSTESKSSPSPPKDGNRTNDDESSTKETPDPFGELVKPELIELPSPDIDFIRDLESRPEIHISRQDLGRINEEISEGLEGPEERNEVTKAPRKIETVEGTKEEDLRESIHSPNIKNVKEDDVVTEEEVGDAIKQPLTTETTEKPEVAEEVIESPDGSVTKKENEDDGVAEVEVDGASEPLETFNTMEDTKEEVQKVVTVSPNPGVAEKDEDDDIIRKFIATEEMEILARSDTEKGIEGNARSRDSSMSTSENQIDALEKRELDKSKSRTVSDLSPEAYRPDLYSESSNEAKESSEPDEPFESVKGPNSMDEEEISGTRSPESSNEVKETTLTDGLSLSLDPMRPYVPELNLDSLQDITVSSFKMTEDEYDNQGPGGSGKTNSIADTLTFDENHRIIEGAEFAEEAVLEYLVSSSDRSHAEEAGLDQEEKEEVVEEPIVKNRVEIKEDICEKSNAYVTGPSHEEESLASVDSNLDEVELAIRSEKTEEEVVEEDIVERSTESHKEEIPATNMEEDEGSKQEPENVTEEEAIGGLSADRVADEIPSEEQGKIIKADGEDNESTEEQSNDKSTSFEVKEMEEINEDDSKPSQTPVVEDPDENISKMEDSEPKESGRRDLSGGTRSVEEISEEIAEESFVEEDTPLAVSRSASQCTTRRVSSGNLARLREDPTLGWTEETEQETVDDEDGSSSKVKFSKIGRETIREQGSTDTDPSQHSGSPKNLSDDTDENVTKYSKEYHIYVPEVDTSEDKSTTRTSTVETAVTKIQARVRGFLTRRRFHRGQHNRSSTLGSIPSIQDSIALEPCPIDDGELETVGTTNVTTEETLVSSAMSLDEPGFESAATRIQSNYRGYKARKRLKREDAVQRTTLSVEKSFAESGFQHTGEFHDCIPLPLHDLSFEKKFPISTDNKLQSFFQHQSASHPLTTESINSKTFCNEKNVENIPHQTSEDFERLRNSEKMFFAQSTKVPVIQFGINPNISHLVDLVVLAKDEAALENDYLNFITSVEDAETIVPNLEINPNGKEFIDDNRSNESLKEPLALSVTPVGLIIEEITNSDVERFLNNRSSESSIIIAEKSTDPPNSPRAPCASSETISESIEVSKMEEIVTEAPIPPETAENRRSSSQNVENLVLPAESMILPIGIVESFSLPDEKVLLGPESSVDSLECPVVENKDKSSSGSSGKIVEDSSVEKDEDGEISNEGKFSYEDEINDSVGSEIIRQITEEDEQAIDKMNEASSALSFSLTAEDLLGLGSDDSLKIHGKKPILEVTLTPGDIMKSMSLSQESQLAGERMESPITMVQLATAHSDSLQLEEPSKSSCEDEESTSKPVSPISVKSEHK